MPKARIYLSPPHMGGEEKKFVDEAFETNWIAPVGPHITAFENELAAYNGIRYCAALSSGTAAIHLALIMLGVVRDDEVLCSSFTFSGSCNPIVYQGAVPVFVDSEPTTWNMDPVLLEEAILDRQRKRGKVPKVLILVHLYGVPAQIDKLMAVANKYRIPVIEDAAEALGSRFKDQKLGTFGEIGIYSFNGNKIITTAGGGSMVSNNEEWIKKARFLATQARDAAPHYEHSHIGYNYRLSNVSAGIGRGQLKVLDRWILARRENHRYYRRHLNLPGIRFQEESADSVSNRWLTTVLVNPSENQGITNEALRLALEGESIESRPLWKPMHLQPVFRDAPAYVNGVSEGLFRTGLCLPSGSSLTPADLESVVQGVRKTIDFHH